MLEIPTLTGEDIDRQLLTGSNLGLLRFIICGSVDDGKSTLIGRLLYDSGQLLDDQLSALEDESGRIDGAGGELDFSLLVDGLQAEREQGITIDVAFRYFASARRKFIVADTPGHEQYTRNMATGASTAELAVILIDARKGVLTQTRRHSYIVSLLGISHVVLAVNKMDLVGYSRDTFDANVADYHGFAEQLGFAEIQPIPVSALKGDNIFEPGNRMSWYRGPTLMEHLERVDVGSPRTDGPFRMPVQWVNRPDTDFRGYAGTVMGGSTKPGDDVVIAPSGKTSRITRIVTFDGDLDEAMTGQAVTLVLADAIDVSRGDVIGTADAEPEITDQFRAHILWMSEEEMFPGRSYALKIGTQTTLATVSDIRYAINVNTLEHIAVKTLALNEIGCCNISLDRAVAYDPYNKNRETGSFIFIDRSTKNTVGAGMIEYGLRRATNIAWQALQVDKSAHSTLKNQKPCVLWFTGLSGSGKSTIADLVEKRLHSLGKHTLILDGDNVRHGLNRDLGFTEADRVENIRRIGEVSKLFVDAGLIVLVSFISPFESERKMARELVEQDEFMEIFIDTPLDICEKRDPKGLYKKARDGQLANFTGIDSLYEIPTDPEILISTENASADQSTEQIIQALNERGII